MICTIEDIIRKKGQCRLNRTHPLQRGEEQPTGDSSPPLWLTNLPAPGLPKDNLFYEFQKWMANSPTIFEKEQVIF